MVLFTDKILKNYLRKQARVTICFKTRDRVCVFKTFEALRENVKLDQDLEKVGQAFKKLATMIKKLDHVLALKYKPWCPKQPS